MKKRIFNTSLAVCACLSLSIICNTNSTVVNAKDISDEEMVEVIETNLETGETTTIDIPLSEDCDGDTYNPNPTVRDIIGVDNRTRIPTSIMNIFPFCSHGVVYCTWPNGQRTYGTGWLFGPNDIATAAHVVYDITLGGAPSSIRFYPGVNGPSLGAGYDAKNVSLSAEWQNGENPRYDYAVFEINSNIGDSRGFYGWSSSASVNNSVQVMGYPESYELWADTRSVVGVDSSFVYYDVDTTEGESGAPVYNTISQNVIAIHRGGLDSTKNRGVRINAEIANILSYYRNK